jgi:hypothetical protein
MSLVVKDNGSKDFKLLEAGLYAAVCSNVIDMGDHEGQYGVKPKIGIVFELNELRDDGKRYQLSMTQGNTLASKGHLRPMLESWRGKKFTEDELKNGFDLEKLIGANCTLNITHDIKQDKTYLKINAVNPPMRGAEKIVPSGLPIPEWIVKLTNEGLALREKLARENHPDTGSQVQPTNSGDDNDLPF